MTGTRRSSVSQAAFKVLLFCALLALVLATFGGSAGAKKKSVPVLKKGIYWEGGGVCRDDICRGGAKTAAKGPTAKNRLEKLWLRVPTVALDPVSGSCPGKVGTNEDAGIKRQFNRRFDSKGKLKSFKLTVNTIGYAPDSSTLMVPTVWKFTGKINRSTKFTIGAELISAGACTISAAQERKYSATYVPKH